MSCICGKCHEYRYCLFRLSSAVVSLLSASCSGLWPGFARLAEWLLGARAFPAVGIRPRGWCPQGHPAKSMRLCVRRKALPGEADAITRFAAEVRCWLRPLWGGWHVDTRGAQHGLAQSSQFSSARSANLQCFRRESFMRMGCWWISLRHPLLQGACRLIGTMGRVLPYPCRVRGRSVRLGGPALLRRHQQTPYSSSCYLPDPGLDRMRKTDRRSGMIRRGNSMRTVQRTNGL